MVVSGTVAASPTAGLDSLGLIRDDFAAWREGHARGGMDELDCAAAGAGDDAAPRRETDARDRLKTAIRPFGKPLGAFVARDADEGDTRLLVTDFFGDAGNPRVWGCESLAPLSLVQECRRP
jgi:hypothetical protein